MWRGGDRIVRKKKVEKGHTLIHLDTFDRLIENSTSALFEESIALRAKVNHFYTLDRQFNDFFDDIANNICCKLVSNSPNRICKRNKINRQLLNARPKKTSKNGDIRNRGGGKKKILTLYLVRSASRVETGFLSAAGTFFSASDIGVGWRVGVLYAHAQHTYTRTYDKSSHSQIG